MRAFTVNNKYTGQYAKSERSNYLHDFSLLLLSIHDLGTDKKLIISYIIHSLIRNPLY